MADTPASGSRPAPIPPELISDGHLVIGGTPRFHLVARWATVADVPGRPLPPIPSYDCLRVASPPAMTGPLDAVWDRATWSEPFGRIEDGARTGHETRVALLWDDECLYAAYRVTDPDIRAASTVHHDQIYMTDDDVEIFVEADAGYYELGVNPINTIYEFRWTWVQRLLEAGDAAALEALFKLPDFIYYTARGGETLGRIGEMDYDLPGVRHSVQVKGTVNWSQDVDEGWIARFALPWTGLQGVGRDPGLFPPKAGDTIRIQGYRAQHDWTDSEGAATMGASWPGASPFQGNTWSTMGNGNVHNPERWVPVRFLGDEV